MRCFQELAWPRDNFWQALDQIVHQFGTRNRELLSVRAGMQQQIDEWHRSRKGEPLDSAAYEAFLRDIDYLLPEGPDFQVKTANVDPEISEVAGPQLVVPVSNARYAINAANARWGSLYDAYYGTDALGDLPTTAQYDAERGARVIAAGHKFLDANFALRSQGYGQVTGFRCADDGLHVTLADGTSTGLAQPSQFVGWSGSAQDPGCLLLKNNGLHVEIVIDRSDAIGGADPAGVADIRLEAALTTICDLEDSIAAVDASDKVAAYRNWLGLMKGDLVETFEKGWQDHPPRPDGGPALFGAKMGPRLGCRVAPCCWCAMSAT